MGLCSCRGRQVWFPSAPIRKDYISLRSMLPTQTCPCAVSSFPALQTAVVFCSFLSMFSEIGHCHFWAAWLIQARYMNLVSSLFNILSSLQRGIISKAFNSGAHNFSWSLHQNWVSGRAGTGVFNGLSWQPEHLADCVSFLALIWPINFGLNLRKKKEKKKTPEKP